MKNIEERFLSYVAIDTTSTENGKTPSSENQFVLAKQLVEELKELGVSDAFMAENSFVYGTIESNCDHQVPSVGFLAHMDTSDATSGKDIKPHIIRRYDGKDIRLSEGIYSTLKDYPFLKNYVGKDLIVTDGTTLLGADDKAGIAIIMEMIHELNEKQIQHGKLYICFTPDEEIGEGIHHIDLNQFKPDYAYTLDGGEINVISYENFNAATAVVNFTGNSVHPGSAKGVMVNAIRLAMQFDDMLPTFARPEFTENREGFNHLLELNGDCQSAKSVYIIRNHDKAQLEKQMHDFELITMHMNEMAGKQVVELDMRRTYSNMKECFEGKMFIVEQAMEAIKEFGYTPIAEPIRGGTDGAELSYKGIPTANLGTGGANYHGNHEFVCLNDMKEMVQILCRLIERTVKG